MKPFPLTLKVEDFEINLTVTHLDEHHRRFRLERMEGEKAPVILTRSDGNVWIIDNPGKWPVPETAFQNLGREIDDHLDNLTHMKALLALTDFSEAAENAVKYAASFTRQANTAALIIYHSYEFDSVAVNFNNPTPGSVIATPETDREQLHRLERRFQPLVSEKTALRIYADKLPFVSGVNAIIEQQHVGLVVIGTTGKTDIEKILVGSHTITMAKECTVPLLVIPQQAVFEEIRRIVFACNLEKGYSVSQVDTIKAFARDLNARLFLLNVVDGEDGTDHQSATSGRAELEKHWGEDYPEYHVIRHEDIAEGIMQFADKQGAQLVITIPQKYGFFESLFHRSLTKKLAYHTHLPLLLMNDKV
jgi:nucleotide-binding universal stress UspA family protein